MIAEDEAAIGDSANDERAVVVANWAHHEGIHGEQISQGLFGLSCGRCVDGCRFDASADIGEQEERVCRING